MKKLYLLFLIIPFAWVLISYSPTITNEYAEAPQYEAVVLDMVYEAKMASKDGIVCEQVFTANLNGANITVHNNVSSYCYEIEDTILVTNGENGSYVAIRPVWEINSTLL
ncbi:hypothetical protein HOM98_06060 [Candidatus Peregrinibacteria bacterium]|jgi:hypothetical protein|nr:hypothetical protein [Candidatus Peregrinibacteria bacterium]MBT7484639.1 hypothetical protein [Candidatus Peregrinibacteria bacterium]